MSYRTILRPIPGVEQAPGTVVDVSGWRNAPALELQRYLGPAEQPAEPSASTPPAKGGLRTRKETS